MLISGKKQMDCKQVTWKWIFTSRSTGWSICFFILLGHVTNANCHRKVQPLPCLFILCAEVALRPAACALECCCIEPESANTVNLPCIPPTIRIEERL